MLVQSWLQVPYTEHSSKSAGKRARAQSFRGMWAGMWVPSDATVGVFLPTSTLENNLTNFIARHVPTVSPRQSRLGLYPTEMCTDMPTIHSFRKDFLTTCYVQGSGDMSVNKTDSHCCPHEI